MRAVRRSGSSLCPSHVRTASGRSNRKRAVAALSRSSSGPGVPASSMAARISPKRLPKASGPRVPSGGLGDRSPAAPCRNRHGAAVSASTSTIS